MTLKLKSFRFLASLTLLLAVGCSGINASKSVSPLDFILPGLMQADPQPATDDFVLPAPGASNPIALVR